MVVPEFFVILINPISDGLWLPRRRRAPFGSDQEVNLRKIENRSENVTEGREEGER
ncbi:hypothetical protein JZ751_022895 [Albula glossodonta]|uniref:Uncharacterized protein n=1 Tax=Albula glossodonta TaxID=121402 RepID=A0A8T2PGL0_9TELE|nr:hypothetical protein JZ751_022895 [Albula glossodonta]